MRRFVAPLIAVILGAALIASEVIRLPYFSEGPGPTHDVLPLIHVDGHETYPTDGELLLTTVSFSPERLTALDYLATWLDPHEDLVPEHDFLSPGQTIQQETELEKFAMDQSQLSATYVALTKIGDYPKEHGSGALIEYTLPGCDADGRLFPGNVITAVNGEHVNNSAEASRLIDSTPPGRPIEFTAAAGSKDVGVKLTRTPCGPHGEDLVGVGVMNNFPYTVNISSANIGGPSAGLMFALGVYDKLTPGDLTGGRVIAGTGEIHFDGKVSPIGGVEKKVYAADKAGAVMFLVPDKDYAAAVAAGVDIPLVRISNFDEALGALNSDTGTDSGKGN